MGSITINGLLGFGMIIAMLYSATDIDAAVETPTGYPFMEIFYQATGSINGTAGMASLIVLMTLSATVGVIASTSRMLWAFARDNAMPFSSTLSKVRFYILCISKANNLGGTSNQHARLVHLNHMSHFLPHRTHQPRLNSRLQRHRLSCDFRSLRILFHARHSPPLSSLR